MRIKTAVCLLLVMVLLLGCSGKSEYEKLMVEARSLRAYSVEDFVQKLPARAEVKQKAERTLSRGKITQSQYEAIVKQLQEGIQR